MSGLVLKLSPKERVLINGAVIENGDRRSRLSIVTPGANILRLRDAIHPEDVTTPVKRVCYVAQLVLSGDALRVSARMRSGIMGNARLSAISRLLSLNATLNSAISLFLASRPNPSG